MQEKAGVRTVVRFRPPNAREKGLGYKDGDNGIVVKPPGTITVSKGDGGVDVEPKHFHVNHVFGGAATQKDVFDVTGKDTLADVFQGYNGTIFAYGQTGAGKSFSMFGLVGDGQLEGIIPRTMKALFSHVFNSPADVEFKIACSYVEVYKEELRDLLAVEQKRLTIRQSPHKGIYVENLHLEYVESENDVYDCLQVGNEQRKTGRTNMNAQSSRSHCVFTLYVEQSDNDGTTRQAKLNLVDLAGSEKVRKSGASGETLEEAKKINLSLTCLSQCINALTSEKATHVPYRTSKLTRLLQESLGGNAKTTLLVACSPSIDNIEETVASLRFAERCMTIKNEVVANVQLSPEQLTQMVAALTAELTALKKHSAGMERKLKELGVSPQGLGAQELLVQDFSAQHPEHARIRPQDLVAHPSGHVIVIAEGEGEGGDAQGSVGEGLDQPQHKHARLESKATIPDIQTNLAWVSAHVSLSGYTREQLGEEGTEAFAAAVWSCVQDAGVERDDVFINKIVQQGADVLELHPVIACDSPMADDVMEMLNSKIRSGELTHELLRSGVLKNKHDIRVDGPSVEEKDDDEHEAAVHHSQLARVERLASIVGDPHQLADVSNVNLGEELERLSKQRVEDEAELDALRAEVCRMKTAQQELEGKCDMLQLEVDSTKERLVTANTKLLAQAKAKPKQSEKLPNEPRRASQSPVLQPAVPKRSRPGSRAFTSRVNDDDNDDDDAPRHKLFSRLRHRIKLPELASHRDKPGTNVRLGREQSVSSEETDRGALQKVARVVPDGRSDPQLFKIDSQADNDEDSPEGSFNVAGSHKTIPALVLPALLSSPGAVPSLAVTPASNEFADPVAAPRRREDEELDELLKKQEELSKTVRRQQGLIERQAEALQKVGERAHKAEHESLLLTQEREEMEERIMRLELKLHKHGLGERRGSIAHMERLSFEGGDANSNPPSRQHTNAEESSRGDSFRLNNAGGSFHDLGIGGDAGPLSGASKLATSRAARKIALPSQRDHPQTGRPHTGRPHTGRGVVGGGGTIRNPVRDQKNSAVGRARQEKGVTALRGGVVAGVIWLLVVVAGDAGSEGVIGGLLNAPALLSSFFFDDNEPSPVQENDEEEHDDEEEEEKGQEGEGEDEHAARGSRSPSRPRSRSRNFFGF